MTDTPLAITLASASPRRRELLGLLGVAFRTAANDAEEQAHPPPAEIQAALPALDLPLFDHPTLRAWRKADAACTSAPRNGIIGADTIVVLDETVLNKPRDAADAQRMLRMLSGRIHTVYTGLCVLWPRHARRTGSWSMVPGSWSVLLDLVATEVRFHELNDDTIRAYVATGEPLDKAGAYGVQGGGGRLIAEVIGSYTNVVGLPLTPLHRLLTAAGIGGLAEPAEAYQRWLAAQGKELPPCPPTFP